MEIKRVELIQIKKTKSVLMYYDEVNNEIILNMIKDNGAIYDVLIPISKAFQVKRGLESAVQRFYRKKKK